MVATAQRTRTLAVSKIAPNPDQPRQHFDQVALDELADSLRQYGLLQPLVVRPVNGTYQIVAGERRWRAAQLAGLDKLPCMVLEGMDDEEAFILSTTENVVRKDMTCIEEAKAYARIQALGRTSEEVAKLFGKTAAEIDMRLLLLNLREDLQHLVAHGSIGKNLGWYLARLSIEGQTEVIGKLQRGELKNEELAYKYANAVFMREQQGDLFPGLTVSPEVAQRRAVRRDQMQKAWEQIEGMAKALAVFNTMTEEEIADALGPDVAKYRDRLAALEQDARRTKTRLQNAEALHLAAVEAERNGG